MRIAEASGSGPADLLSAGHSSRPSLLIVFISTSATSSAACWLGRSRDNPWANSPAALPQDFTVGVGTSAWQVEGATSSRGRTHLGRLQLGRGRSLTGAWAIRPASTSPGWSPTSPARAAGRGRVPVLDLVGQGAARGPRPDLGGRSGPLRPALRCAAQPGDHPLVTRTLGGPAQCELHAAGGGWLDRRPAGCLGQCANAVASRSVTAWGLWATLNEPWCSAFLGDAPVFAPPGRGCGGPGGGLPAAGGPRPRTTREGLRRGGRATPGSCSTSCPPFRRPVPRGPGSPSGRPATSTGCRTTCGSTRSPGVASTPTSWPPPPGSDWSFVSSDDETAIGAPLNGRASTTTRSSDSSRSMRRPSQRARTPQRIPRAHQCTSPPGSRTRPWGGRSVPRGLGTTPRRPPTQSPGVPLWVAENGRHGADAVADGGVRRPRTRGLPAGPPGAGGACSGRGRRRARVPGVVAVRQWAQAGASASDLHVDQDTQVRNAQVQRALAARLQAERRGPVSG